MNILLIFLGGGIGSVLRYLANIFVRNSTGNDFPYGVMLINILGSFFIGLTYALVKKSEISTDHITAFVMVGLLGGFTTFSAFSLDVVTLVNDGKAPAALIYVLASVVLSILAAAFAIILAR